MKTITILCAAVLLLSGCATMKTPDSLIPFGINGDIEFTHDNPWFHVSISANGVHVEDGVLKAELVTYSRTSALSSTHITVEDYSRKIKAKK